MSGIYESKWLCTNVSSNQNNVLLVASPGVGKQIVVERVILSLDSANSMTFQLDADASLLWGKFYFLGPDAYDSRENLDVLVGPNKALKYTATFTSGNVGLLIKYHIRG